MEINADSASAVAQAQVQDQISMKVAKKTLDAQRDEGEAAIALLEAAAKTAPKVGEGYVGGGKADVYA